MAHGASSTGQTERLCAPPWVPTSSAEFSEWQASPFETKREKSDMPKTLTIDDERLPTIAPMSQPTRPRFASSGDACGGADTEFPRRNTTPSRRDSAVLVRSARRNPSGRSASIIAIRPARCAASSAANAIRRSGFAVIVRPWCERRWSIWRLPVAIRKPVGWSDAQSGPARRPKNPRGGVPAGAVRRIAFRQVSDLRIRVKLYCTVHQRFPRLQPLRNSQAPGSQLANAAEKRIQDEVRDEDMLVLSFTGFDR